MSKRKRAALHKMSASLGARRYIALALGYSLIGDNYFSDSLGYLLPEILITARIAQT